MATQHAYSPPTDRDLPEQHIRRVVLPLFRQVAEAVRISGHYGIAAPVVTRVLAGARPQPFVTGAFLGLAPGQPGLDEDYDGIIKVVPATGAAFLLIEKAPAFDRIEGASLDELGELRLIDIVREIVARTFR